MSRLTELSDYDFERLVADLLSADWSVTVETFPKGRDGGVDLRVLGPTNAPLSLPESEELVVQCKHRPLAGFAQIRAEVVAESKKPIVSSASRYVFVTSARLTRSNKAEMAEIFGRRVSQRDILGQDDVENLLRRNPAVERSNVRLWLSSPAIIEAIGAQVENLRSSSLVSEIQRLKPTLVETQSVKDALQRLRKFGVCMLVGPPGVGKTTAAYVLLLRLMAEGWRPAVAIGQVRELEVQWLSGVNQILFFDDFLGQNSLEAKFVRGEDSELKRLMAAVERDPTKLLILTTRDYVFRQARLSYEKLEDSLFNDAKVAVQLSMLDNRTKAHILYNQLYFSPIRKLAASAVNGKRRYAKIVEHTNYNPRLIEAAIFAIAREQRLLRSGVERDIAWGDLGAEGNSSGHASDDGAATAQQAVDVPARLEGALAQQDNLWRHVLERQLTVLQRTVLLVRISFGSRPVFLADLYRATGSRGTGSGSPCTRQEIDLALSVLDGDLLTVRDAETPTDERIVDRLNPGVADALVAHLRRYPDEALGLVDSATSFAQIEWLSRFYGITNGGMEPALASRLLRAAERTLSSPSSSPDQDTIVLTWRPNLYYDIGSRFELLESLSIAASLPLSEEFGDQVVPRLLDKIRTVNVDQLVKVVRCLRRPPFAAWKPRNTDVEVAILSALDEPEDSDDWRALVDVLSAIRVTPEYEMDLKQRFEEYAVDRVDELRDELRDDSFSARSELEELAAVAEDFGVALDLDDVLDDLASEGEEEPVVHHLGQLAIPELSKSVPASSPPEDIFDSL